MTAWHGGKRLAFLMSGLGNRRRRAYEGGRVANPVSHSWRDWAVLGACCRRGSAGSAGIRSDLVVRVSCWKVVWGGRSSVGLTCVHLSESGWMRVLLSGNPCLSRTLCLKGRGHLSDVHRLIFVLHVDSDLLLHFLGLGIHGG